MDHKAVILLMLVCFVIMTLCVATPTISYSSSKPYSSHTQREDGLYDDGLYHHMASGLTSPQPHSVSDQDFVLNGRELLEDVNQIPSSVMDSMYDYNKRDVEALLTLKDTIKYDPSGSLSNWKAEKAEKVCSWPGISCNGQDSENVCPWNGMPCRQPNQRVVAIILPGLGLEGTLSAFLGNLSFLHTLDFSNNSFNGRIPKEFGQLKELQTLSLSANKFSGSIPVDLGLLQKLEYLDLQSNKLENAIPSSLGNCSSLKSLFLGNNLLSGSIPPHLGNLRELTHLSIYSPRSSYYPPRSPGSISGSIPSEIGNCSNLVVLDLGGNRIQGSVPTSIFQLSLAVLDLGGNSITGNIPLAIANLTQLTRLHLNSNNITGSIPQTNLTQLTHLFLDSNFLTGSIPNSITRLNELEVLDLSENNLEGHISEDICNCMKMTNLNLRNNSLSGRIPRSLHNCTALKRLTVSENSLSGDLDIGFPVFMEILSAHSNIFSGTLPASLANCTTLQVLDLKENQLKGEFPRYYSNLDDLRVLSVGNNLLHGGIISRITNLTKLQVLDLSNNKFSGRIPWDLGKLQGFSFKGSQQLNAGALYVSLKIEIKGFEYSLIYILITNTILDLSNNNFMGEIPASIGSLRSLRLLNLSGNQLEGKIPISLGYISTLEQLDLAKNNMSGAIPQQLNVLSMLAYIDFSANHLCGPIPNGTQFSTFEASSYKKNKCLCGIPLHPCNIEMDKRKGHTSSKSINVKGWLSHVDENVSLIALGMGVRIGFGIIISMFITWERAKHWVLALPPKTPPPFFYRVY